MFSVHSTALAVVLALPAVASAAQEIAPKVMVITMFGNEAAPWFENEALNRRIPVRGLSKEHPDVACDEAGLCVMTTQMGYANAASSVAALIFSDALDLSRTYFLVAGIAGVDPADGTLGSAHWARYVIDGGLRHDIDPRQVPQDWESGVIGLGASAPDEAPGWAAGTEVFKLSEPLVEKALELTRDVDLADSEGAQAYRSGYAEAAAKGAPGVSICDTVSSNTYWHGARNAQAMEAWAALLTQGEANYCTTQMEDNATLTALQRGADAGLLDLDRVAVLRTASNFDREGPGQTASESLEAESGGFGPATENAYRVGAALAAAIIADWEQWEDGVPPE